ncbi:MAG TPA: MoaD/ThiS family protein [Aestuariivirgaceae bacterium]|nr:MoaD/ThiS family protein [Aestuariivirgaceae bacterium]
MIGTKPQGERVRVTLWGSLRSAAEGRDTVEVEAATIRELFSRLGKSYPGLKPFIDRGIAVSINGQIFRDSWSQSIPKGAEVYLLPRIAGG